MSASQRLQDALERELPLLRGVSEERSSVPRGTGKWSPREELGHLIDSASNNHQRFVRAALDGAYQGPSYAQEDWVRVHRYTETPWRELVDLWDAYNRLLARLIAALPAGRLEAECTIAGHAPVTLAWLIDDYIVHMQHHLDLLLLREKVTPYPR